jgi:hypothetical protein
VPNALKPLRALGLLCAALAGSTAHARIIYDNGPPTQAGGNEVTQWVQTEDVLVNATTAVVSAQFWTAEAPGSWDGTLDYYFFADAGGKPASAPLVMGAGTDIVKVATGLTDLGYPEYSYTFDLPTPFTLAGGTTYWFGLHLAQDFSTRDNIYWESMTPPLGQGAYGEESAGGLFNNWFNNGQQHAFNLSNAPEPSTAVLAAIGGLASWGCCRGRSWRAMKK